MTRAAETVAWFAFGGGREDWILQAGAERGRASWYWLFGQAAFWLARR